MRKIMMQAVKKILILFAIIILITIIIDKKVYAKTQEISSKWDNAEHISKDGMYSYYLSEDKTSVKIYYYEGSWDISELVIPSRIDGYIVTAIGNDILNPSKHPFSYLDDTVKKIILPDSVNELEEGIFSQMKKLQEVHLPDQIKELPSKLFCGCSSLNSLKFPKMLEKIDDRVFVDTAFSKIVIPNTVYSIGEYSFASENLEEVILPEGIKEINNGVFSGTGLKELRIPDSVTSISNEAFSNCRQLKNITFGKNINFIGWAAFQSTPWLLEKAKEDFVMVNGKLLIQYNGSSDTPVIPDGITAIIASAFSDSNICSITIPDTVTYIGGYAFSNCHKLTKAVLSSNIKSIGESSFSNCAISEITIPDSVTEIGKYAFEHCTQLSTIHFGKNLICLGPHAFKNTPWLTVQAVKEYVMVNHVLLKYNGKSDQPVIPTGTVSIAGGAFEGVYLSSMTIPDTVTYIGDFAFSYTQLKSLYFEGNAPLIGTHVFTSYDSNENAIHPKMYYKKGCIGYDTKVWNWYQPSDGAESVTEKDNTSTGEITAASIKIDEKHFPDKYFRCFVTQYDNNKDGYLSQEETDPVTNLYFGPDNCLDSVKSIKGIENFNNLMSISLDSRSLKNVDLSKNMKLKSLYTQNLDLDSIIVSGCKKLTSVSLWDSKIKKLDLSKNRLLQVFHCPFSTFKSVKLNSNIRDLRCSGSNLFSFGISKLLNLKVLNCENCNLSSLSLSPFRKLEELYCGDNKLNKLDISKNTRLIILDCEKNQLKKISFGEAENLVQLDCSYNKFSSLSLHSFNNIKYLNCANNKLSNLDLTSNSKLENLNCSNIKLKSLDLTNNINLKILICTNSALNYLELSQNINLNTLDCSDNSIKTLNLVTNNLLENLSCNNNQLEKLDISSLTLLRELHCNNNRISSFDFRNNYFLDTLYCNKNQFASLDVSANRLLIIFYYDKNVKVTGWPNN